MSAKKIALTGLLVAAAMVLSYVEAMIPVFVAVPGVKLGLPNIVIVFALYRLGFRPAVLISLIRVVLVAFTFGNAFSLVYSLAGAVLSLIVMGLLKRSDTLSVTGVSVIGAVCHNIGQILVAIVVLETGSLIYYLPVLLVTGVIAGVCIGLLAGVLTKRIPKLD
jgi:heptaprenyl diphosphate synthase